MKLIMENWRKFLGLSDTSMPKLNPPKEIPPHDEDYPDMVGRSAHRSGKGLKIDFDPQNPEAAIDALQRDAMGMIKSDSPLNVQIIDDMMSALADAEHNAHSQGGSLSPEDKTRIDKKIEDIRKMILARKTEVDFSRDNTLDFGSKE